MKTAVGRESPSVGCVIAVGLAVGVGAGERGQRRTAATSAMTATATVIAMIAVRRGMGVWSRYAVAFGDCYSTTGGARVRGVSRARTASRGTDTQVGRLRSS